MSYALIIIASLAAGVAGFVDAIAGGGGIIVVPTLFLLGLPPTIVLGTNKLASSLGTTAAVISFIRGGRVHKDIALRATPLTAIGAFLGVLSVSQMGQEYLKPLATALTFLLALYFFFRPKLGLLGTYTGLTSKLLGIILFGSFVIGFYDGFFGPGTGAFLTFMFVRLVGMDFVSAAANTKVLNWTSNVVALSIFLVKGSVDFSIGIPMAIASILGGHFGAQFAQKHGAAWVRWIFLAMALLLSLKLAFT